MKLKLSIIVLVTVLAVACKKHSVDTPTTLTADKTSVVFGNTVNFTAGAESGSVLNWTVTPEVGVTKQYSSDVSVVNAIKFDSIGEYYVTVKAQHKQKDSTHSHHNNHNNQNGGRCHSHSDSAKLKIIVTSF